MTAVLTFISIVATYIIFMPLFLLLLTMGHPLPEGDAVVLAGVSGLNICFDVSSFPAFWCGIYVALKTTQRQPFSILKYFIISVTTALLAGAAFSESFGMDFGMFAFRINVLSSAILLGLCSLALAKTRFSLIYKPLKGV